MSTVFHLGVSSMEKSFVKLLVCALLIGGFSPLVCVSDQGENFWKNNFGQKLAEIKPLYEKLKPYLGNKLLTDLCDSLLSDCLFNKDNNDDPEWYGNKVSKYRLEDFAYSLGAHHKYLETLKDQIDYKKEFPYEKAKEGDSSGIEVEEEFYKVEGKKEDDEVYQQLAKVLPQLEELYEEATSPTALRRRGEWTDYSLNDLRKKCSYSYYGNPELVAQIKDLVQKVGTLEKQAVEDLYAKREMEISRDAVLSQRNGSLFGAAVLGGLLLESLRKKSYVRRGVHALWNKVRRLFRTEQPLLPPEKRTETKKELQKNK